jgi:CHAD domain-containing protein
MKPAGKWIVELPAATPLREAAAMVLRDRAKSLRQPPQGCRQPRPAPTPRSFTAIRVCSRRVEAALKMFGAWVEGRELRALRKLRRRAKRLRRVAGVVRDADVHARVFQEVGDRANGTQAEAVEYLLGRTAATRAEAQAELLTLVGRRARTRIDRWRRRVARAVGAHAESGAASLAEAGKAALAVHIQAVRAAADRDLTSLENLHALRLKIKGLRYGLELAAPALAPEDSAAAYLAVCDAQERLGEINDGETVLARLRDELDRIGREEDGTRAGRAHIAGLNLLRDRFAAVRDRRLERFWSAWTELDFGSTLDALEAAAAPSHADAETAEEAAAESWRGRATPSAIAGHDALARLAAIDVGSNSVRLVIAEAYPDGTYRIVDDEKEQTRLARGLARTGRLDPTVMDEAATVIARLRAIADGYNCTHRRAVATAAVREAANGAEFLELVRDRANVELRVISAEEEGRLAFASVSHAFTDIRTLPAGVMDIGGASTEVVLSSSGVIDDIATLGMGAVSLTERFGGPDRSAGDRFRKMRGLGPQGDPPPHARDQRAPRPPRRHRAEPSPPSRPWRSSATAASAAALRPTIAQGYQVTYGTIRDLLRELRDLRAAERTRIPGLSADRADIIVAGLCVVKEVMRHLRVRRLRVHTYGVRDGLLLSMMRTVFPIPAARVRRAQPRLRTPSRRTPIRPDLPLRRAPQRARRPPLAPDLRRHGTPPSRP